MPYPNAKYPPAKRGDSAIRSLVTEECPILPDAYLVEVALYRFPEVSGDWVVRVFADFADVSEFALGCRPKCFRYSFYCGGDLIDSPPMLSSCLLSRSEIARMHLHLRDRGFIHSSASKIDG